MAQVVQKNGLAYMSVALKPKSENATDTQPAKDSEDVGF